VEHAQPGARRLLQQLIMHTHHAKRDVHEPRHDSRPAIITLTLSALATYGWLAHMIWSMT
jgi:hypothetical protein